MWLKGFRRLTTNSNCEIRHCLFRCISSINGFTPQSKQPLSLWDKKNFDQIYPQIVSELTSHDDKYVKPIAENCEAVLENYTLYRKKERGLLTVAAYNILTGEQSEEQLLRANRMGWCVEMVQGHLLAYNNAVEILNKRNSDGQYNKSVKSSAVTQLPILKNAIFHLLKKHFRGDRFYINAVNLFHEILLRGAYSQKLTMQLCNQHVDLEQFTQENYGAIVENSTALYSFYLPVTLAMNLAGIYDTKVLDETKKILLKIGFLFQVQQDYLDCFGNPFRIGPDIENGKCTWLIVNGLKLCNKSEENTLKESYGKNNPTMVKLVVNIYKELQLDLLFLAYEKEAYDSILTCINELPPKVSSEIFHFCLQLISRPIRK